MQEGCSQLTLQSHPSVTCETADQPRSVQPPCVRWGWSPSLSGCHSARPMSQSGWSRNSHSRTALGDRGTSRELEGALEGSKLWAQSLMTPVCQAKKIMKSHRVSFALLCYHRTVPLDGRDALGPRRASRSAGGESSHGQRAKGVTTVTLCHTFRYK